MNVQMVITCECGNEETINLKRFSMKIGTFDIDNLEISESFDSSEGFRSSKFPEVTRFFCQKCEKFQNVSL